LVILKKGFVRSVSIQPYSPAAGTGLSSHRLNQPGTQRSPKGYKCNGDVPPPKPSTGGLLSITITKIFSLLKARTTAVRRPSF
jgi:hypothetical protein